MPKAANRVLFISVAAFLLKSEKRPQILVTTLKDVAVKQSMRFKTVTYSLSYPKTAHSI